MAAYLIANRPARSQFYASRNRPLTGCTVLHTAESIMDAVGPDTGAENVANFIRTRSTPGSYHDLVDSDSWVHLVPYQSGAFHDGTGSNNWALSLSFACRTSDWRQMSAAKRAGFLRQGARAFAAQQAWRKANGAPLTQLRYITKAQSDAGWSGFTCHGWRDPARRTDPGVAAPNTFPFDEWLDACRAAMGGTPTPAPEDELDATEKKMLKEVHERLTTPVFRDGQFTLIQEIGNIVGAAASSRDASKAAVGMIAGLQAAVAKLAEAGSNGTGVTPEDLQRASYDGAAQAINELIDSAEVTLQAEPQPPAA